MLSSRIPPDIRPYPEPALSQRCEEVDEITDAVRQLSKYLTRVLSNCHGIGLAANQVGRNERLFVYRDGHDSSHTVINPVLSEFSDELWLFKEGCLSFPGMFWYIDRPRRVLLRGLDLEGQDVEVEADELLARLFQHEMDHMDGILIVDRIPLSHRKKALRALDGTKRDERRGGRASTHPDKVRRARS